MIFYRVIVLTVVVLITITNVSSLKLPKLLQKISIRNHMSSQDSSVNKNPFLSIRKKLIVTPLLGLVSLLPTKIVHAASAVKVNGWDIYGRVPYDDWLFTNWKLTNPDLYKRSLAEVLVAEIPDMLGNYKRRKILNDVFLLMKGFATFSVFVVVAAVVYRNSRKAMQRRRSEEDAIRGYSMPISATRKNNARKGREINEDGWIDMNIYDDDEDDLGKKDDDKRKDDNDDDDDVDDNDDDE